MSNGQAKTLDSLRNLLDRLTSPDITLAEAKLLRQQVLQVMEEAKISTGIASSVKSQLTAAAQSCPC